MSAKEPVLDRYLRSLLSAVPDSGTPVNFRHRLLPEKDERVLRDTLTEL
jgi:hypothetical protein